MLKIYILSLVKKNQSSRVRLFCIFRGSKGCILFSVYLCYFYLVVLVFIFFPTPRVDPLLETYCRPGM